MKKAVVVLIIFLISLNLNATTEFPPLTLEAEILEIVDDFPLGVNPDTVGMIMKLRRDLNKRRFGNKTSAGVEGFYTFEGKKWTLQNLIELEAQLTKSNSSADQKRLANLKELFQKIKEEFIELVKPFLADARGAKGQMIILINEWAGKANRHDSQLLNWSTTKDGEETTAVYSKILTIKMFDMFVSDLLYFLETLLRSCPKACAHFKQIMEQKQQQQQHAACGKTLDGTVE